MRHKEEIPLLVAEIKDELSKLEILVQKLSSQKNTTEEEEIAESAALRLHNFYTGCERIFKLIASEVNGGVPPNASQSAEQQEMGIGHKYLRIAGGLRFRNQYGQSLQKIFAIKIVSKNSPAFNPANNNMMQYTGCI